VQLDETDRFFNDLFGMSWQNEAVLSVDVKRVLLAMTYFVGGASSEGLLRVSGLSPAAFYKALSSAYPHLTPSSSNQYTLHPLTHAFCCAQVNKDNSEFREKSGLSFVEFFHSVAAGAQNNDNRQEIEKELPNIVAAARLANKLKHSLRRGISQEPSRFPAPCRALA